MNLYNAKTGHYTGSRWRPNNARGSGWRLCWRTENSVVSVRKTSSGDVFDGGDVSLSGEASESGSTNGRCESATSSGIDWTCWNDFEKPKNRNTSTQTTSTGSQRTCDSHPVRHMQRLLPNAHVSCLQDGNRLPRSPRPTTSEKHARRVMYIWNCQLSEINDEWTIFTDKQ